MKTKEPMNLYRALAILTMLVVTFGVTAILCLRNHFYLDEWLCLFFLDVIFVLIYIFELEYERKKGALAYNTQNNFMRLAMVYALCAVLTFGMTYLPEFFRPVMLLPVLVCAVSNSTMALVVGLFYDILLCISSGGNFHALLALCLLTLLGAVLSEALREKHFRLKISLLMAFLNLMVPSIFYYLSYKEIDETCFIYGIGNGVATALAAYFLFGIFWKETRREVDNLYLDIVSEDFSEVKALKNFSMSEYRHAKKVSELAYRCAKVTGCNPELCLAAGFYYRMGRWLGEPYIQNSVKKAVGLSFPDTIIQILQEYYGEEQLPSTPESALVHMVDALVKKVDIMDKDVGKSEWNRDILIYQTLNEFSADGLYDASGLTMNQFLKAREFLAKEEMLR